MAFLIRLVAVAMVASLGIAVPACARQDPAPKVAQQSPPPPQEDFIPVDQLPPEDQLPSAPLLIGAYSFALIVFFLYVVSLARRLTNVQRDVDRLEASLKQTGKP